VEGGILVNRSPKVAVITMEGTNNELEAFLSFKYSGGNPEIVHLKKLESKIKKIDDFDIIFFPGGFSAGDYVRAGAIMAARIRSKLLRDIEDFVEEGKPVMGTCNGFQVLVELGLLPDTGRNYSIEAALAPNISNRFEARSVYVRIKKKNCLFLSSFENDQIIKVPIAHSEGRFVTRDDGILKNIRDDGLNVLTYVDDHGRETGYPWNPNGSYMNIAGICNRDGNVLGTMPHPERVFFHYTQPDWTRSRYVDGPGSHFFRNAVRYSIEKF
jgi:phosphoribosylformylglycinamidine synthase I